MKFFFLYVCMKTTRLFTHEQQKNTFDLIWTNGRNTKKKLYDDRMKEKKTTPPVTRYGRVNGKQTKILYFAWIFFRTHTQYTSTSARVVKMYTQVLLASLKSNSKHYTKNIQHTHAEGYFVRR